MRTIKFRGKREDNGEWVYGDLLQYRVLPVIFDNKMEQNEVLDTTVGQFTGLPSQDAQDIYEGDIARRRSYMVGDKYDGFCGIVIYQCGTFIIESFDGNDATLLWDDVADIEILGNIHDNKELLK